MWVNHAFRRVRLPFLVAGWAVVIRSVLHAILALTQAYQPETSIAVILDVPTTALYFALSLAGYRYDVTGFIDLRFFVLGTATWFCLGLTLGFLADRYRKRATGTRGVG